MALDIPIKQYAEEAAAIAPSHEQQFTRLGLKKLIGNVQSYIRLPLLYEHWYVAGFVSEFSRMLVAKTLLERSIVFFRKESGALVALQNRCAHRSFPLSESHLQGDTIKCAYHGIRYDCAGRVLSVPSQQKVPKGGVKLYEVVETGPFAWIWMGEGPADRSKIPDMTPYTSGKWAFSLGTIPMEGNYLLMQENLADLSHLPFLHASTFGVPEAVAALPVEIQTDDVKLTVTFRRNMDNWLSMKPFFPPLFDFAGRVVKTRGGGSYLTPGFFRGASHLDLIDANPGERSEYNFYFDHFLTPASPTNTHYYFAVARDMAIEDDAFTEKSGKVNHAAFLQDSVAVKQIQTLLNEDRHRFRELWVAGDLPAMAVRTMIAALVEREYGTEVA